MNESTGCVSDPGEEVAVILDFDHPINFSILARELSVSLTLSFINFIVSLGFNGYSMKVKSILRL